MDAASIQLYRQSHHTMEFEKDMAFVVTAEAALSYLISYRRDQLGRNAMIVRSYLC